MGSWGSRYYALQSYLSGEDILGVVNLEMLGWDSDDDGLFDIHTRPIANSVELANLVDSLANQYNLGLTSVIHNPGTTASDHSSFWNHGYSAMVFGEAFFSGDGNPYYHTSNDRIEHFNLNYYYALSKLAVATISHLAFYNLIPVDLQSETNAIAIDFVLEQNYPNPFNPSTKINWQSPVGSWQSLKVYDVLGNEVAKLVDEYKPAGSYEVEFNSHSGEVRNLPAGRQGLPSGVYFYQLRAGSYIETKKMILLK